MKHLKKMLVTTFLALGVTFLSVPIMATNSITIPIVVEAKETEARAFIYEWYYKVIDGHLYKRLYNATLGEWEGDWILVQ